MRRPFPLVALALAVSCHGHPRPDLDDTLDAGYQALQRGDLATAAACAEEGRRLALATGATASRRRFLVLHAEVMVEQRRYPEALALLGTPAGREWTRDAVGIRARLTRGRARCHSAEGVEAFRQAEADLETAARWASEIGAADLAGDIDSHRGTCALLQSDYVEAESHFQAALLAGRRAATPLLEAKAAGSLGLVRMRTRRYDEAVDWFGRALALASAAKAQSVVATTLLNQGWCYYTLGDYERAQAVLARARELAESRGQTGNEALSLQMSGNVHYRLGELARAADDYGRALSIARRMGAKKSIAELTSNLAYVALEQGRYDQAELRAHEALALKTELADLPARQHSLLAEGQIWAGRDQPARAESLYRQVLASPHSGRELLWEARAALARLRVAAHRSVEAEAEFGKAFAIMEQSRDELHQAQHRISFFSSLDRFHDDYVDFLVAGGRTERALEIADRSRARLLRELLEAGAEGPLAVPRFQGVARSLGAVVLFYSLARARSFLWVLTTSGIQLHLLDGEDEIRRHVEAHQRLILRGRDPLAEEAADAAWLYRALIAPAEAALAPGSRVVFVPDGPLYQLNPETLVAPAPRPHYWIEDVTLSAAPSVSLLAAARARSPAPAGRPGAAWRPGARGSILLIGDPLPAGDDFPRLAQAEPEIERIAAQFPPAGRAVYTGARAVPSAYRASEPGRFEFIHFAAHAQASRQVPLESAVILTTEKESAKLYAREIAGVAIQAELVTLSACRTAGSRTYAGEGQVGLTWAFLGAGASNVVAGLWNVEDASTAELMADLYRDVRRAWAPAEALREAKLRLLRSQSAYRKPFYWAPFLVYTRDLDRRPRGARAIGGPGPRPSFEGRR